MERALPLGGGLIAAGEKLAVTPAGRPDALSVVGRLMRSMLVTTT